MQKNTNSSIVVGDRTKSIEGELNILDSDLEQFLYSENIINFIPDFSEDKIRNFVKDNIDLRSQSIYCNFIRKINGNKRKS